MALDQSALMDEIVAEFHLERIPEDKREELIAKMGEALMKRIFLATMDKLGESGVAEYEALLEREATPEEVDAFLETKIPAYNVFARNVAVEFKEEMTKEL